MSLQPAAPSEKDGIDKCICFSACNLPGLINHCERYGRFGFVFRKNVVFDLGGRPAIYVDNDIAPILKKFDFLSKFIKNFFDFISVRLFKMVEGSCKVILTDSFLGKSGFEAFYHT